MSLVTIDAIHPKLRGLRPITSAQSSRYFRETTANVSHKLITPGLFTRSRDPEPRYLPPGWLSFVQPEGQIYFFNPRSRVITEAYIYSPEIQKRIIYWAAVIEEIASSSSCGFLITDDIEIFLQLDDDEDTCGYYIIDHTSRTEFWLTEIDTEEIGIPPASSEAHLRLAFEEHYWTHVEYFPMHIKGIPLSVAKELLDILVHARADHLTSTVGTFPYTASQCKDFIEILVAGTTGVAHYVESGTVICVIARIWSQVARHRFLNFYGEQNPRLSRDQRVVEEEPFCKSRILNLISNTFLFGGSRSYENDLEKLWVDNLVYAEPWKQFMNHCITEWKDSALWILALLFVHALFYGFSIGSKSVTLASLAVSAIGFITSMALAHMHRVPLNMETADAADYLAQTCHHSMGFQVLSIAYSVPKALLFWSTILILVQASYAICKSTNPYVAAGLLSISALTLLFTILVTRRGFSTSDSSFRPSWRKLFCLSNESHDDDIERDAGKVMI